MKKLMLALASLGLFALFACQEQGAGFEQEPVGGEEGAFGEGAEQDTQGAFDEMQPEPDSAGDDSIGAEEDVGAETDVGAEESIGSEGSTGEAGSTGEGTGAPGASE